MANNENLINSWFNSWTNITSDGRNDLVFEGRNKLYGAFDLRKAYNRIYVIALFSTIVFFGLGFGIPKIIALLKPVEKVEKEITLELADMEAPPLDEETPPPPPPENPPPPVQETVQFTPPVVVDEIIEEPPPSQEVLEETKAGETTQEGTGDEDLVIELEPGQGKEIIKEEVKEEIFTYVPEMPSFPGGDAALQKYITDNLEYPELAKQNETEGTVIVSFVVEKSGQITGLRVISKKLGDGCEDAAMSVMKSMPNWTPGKQNGSPVKVSINVPIKFKLY